MFAVLGLVLAGCGTDADPSGTGRPDLVIGAPQASAPVAGTSQLVLEIHNRGDGDDRLVEITTDAALAIEIHRTEIDASGRALMRKLEDLPLPAGATMRFRPGGLHLMVVVPDATVVLGSTFEVTLHFARSEPVTIPVPVVGLLDLVEQGTGPEEVRP